MDPRASANRQRDRQRATTAGQSESRPTATSPARLTCLAVEEATSNVSPVSRARSTRPAAEDRALANLRQVLSDLASVFPHHMAIDRSTVSFQPDAPYALDIERFAKLLSSPDKHPADPSSMQAAVDIYKGPFLEGFFVRDAPGFEEFVLAARDRFQRLAGSALSSLATHYAARWNWAAAIDQLSRLMQLDPWSEDVHRRMMDLLARSGRPDAALSHYESFRLDLARELGTVPQQDTVELAERITSRRSSMGRSGPRLLRAPAPPVSTFGREREMDELQALAAAGERLMTITGPGGVGKTHLGLEASEKLAERLGVAAYFVDLASCSDPGLVPALIAEAIGMPLAGAMATEDEVVGKIGDSNLLLVLDNFEHLSEAAPSVARLLAACPHVQVIATSRSRLHIRGENVLNLSPLALPEPGASDERAARSPAVRLFVSRARSAGARGLDLGAVAELCRRVDGLPLAIELTAARVPLLSPSDLLETFSSTVDIPGPGQKDLPPRQRTLRRTISWSYDLLSEEARSVLRTLSVFSRGADLDELAQVAAAPRSILLPIVEELIEASLVHVSEHPRIARPTATELTLLETTRSFAASELAKTDDRSLVMQRHADYFVELAALGDAGIDSAEQATWFEMLEVSHDDFRAALHFTIESGDARRALELSSSLAWFWHLHGHVEEGRSWLRTALALAEDHRGIGSRRHAALAELGSAVLALRQGDVADARRSLEVALPVLQDVGEASAVARALLFLGLAMLNDPGLSSRSIDEAAMLLRHSSEVSRDAGSPAGEARALVSLCSLEVARGDTASAHELADAAIRAALESGVPRDLAIAQTNVALVKSRDGDPGGALCSMGAALATLHSLGDIVYLVYCLDLAGVTLAALGDLGAARAGAEVLGAADALGQRSGVPLPLFMRSLYEEDVQRVRDLLGRAELGALWAIGAARPLDEAVAHAIASVSLHAREPAQPCSTPLM